MQIDNTSSDSKVNSSIQNNLALHSPKCRSTVMREFLQIEAPHLSKISKQVGLDTTKTIKGKVREYSFEESRSILEYRGYDLNQDAKVISFFVNKGGVGKTTLTYLSAQLLTLLGFKVLCIDTDSQGNTTETFNLEEVGHDISEATTVLYDVLNPNNPASIENSILKYSENLHVIPSTIMNQNINDSVLASFKRNTTSIFKSLIQPLKAKYDYILIDCAPNLYGLNASISCAADMVIMPATPHRFAKAGLQQTTELLNDLSSEFKEVLPIPRRVLFNKHHSSKSMTHKYLGEIAGEYPEALLQTVLKENAEYARVVEINENPFANNKFKFITKEICGLVRELTSIPELNLNVKEVKTVH